MALKLPDSAVPMGDFPVAKAVDIDFDDGENLQDKFDNGELGGGGITNVKTYCLLSQLGITTPCTIKDIWDKMPSGSVAFIDTNSSIVTDLDVIRIALGNNDGDEVYGILTVVKLIERTTLEFRRARTDSEMIPDTFIGYCKGSDCTSIQWKRMVITSIADVVSEDTNVKTYCLLSQLGITTPCTIKDIWDKMPSGSITIIDTNSSIVTDLDAIRIALGNNYGDEVYGILTVVKINQRTTLEFRRARTNSEIIPDTFIGYCKGSDCTSIQWKQIAFTTGVADVPQTTLTPVFPSGVVVDSGGVAINYMVRNGWCSVNFAFNIASATTFSWTDIATGLPKPANSVNIVLMNEEGKLNRPIDIKINSTGSVSSRIPAEHSTADWWAGNISYPVAE